MKLLEVERSFLKSDVNHPSCQDVIRFEHLPGAHGKTNGGTDITTAADVEIAR